MPTQERAPPTEWWGVLKKVMKIHGYEAGLNARCLKDQNAPPLSRGTRGTFKTGRTLLCDSLETIRLDSCEP